MDGGNLFSDDLCFTYIELNERIARLVPKKFWTALETKRLDLYEKIHMAGPSRTI